MKYSKAVPLVGLLMFCFMLAAQSAKADDIIFTDVGDTILVTGTNRFSGLSASCSVNTVREQCSVTITPPTGGSFGSTSLPEQLTFLGVNTSGLGISEGNNTLSDLLVIVHVPANIVTLRPESTTVTFLSDPPATAGVEAPSGLGICNQNFFGISILCNITETGGMDTAGTITWNNSAVTDRIIFQSTPEPEPASLMLFGSGLVIAGGFLRRRHRLAVTASV